MSFEQEDRRIQPDLILGTDPESITFDNVLSLLSVHYWWNGDAIRPDDIGFEKILDDASDAQVARIATVLHTELSRFWASGDHDCQLTAAACLEEYVGLNIGDSKRTSLVERAKTFEWLDLLGAGDILQDSEGPSPLLRAYYEFVPRKLLEAGATELEAHWALEALAREEFRRDERSPKVQEVYGRHVVAGGTYESFLTEVVPVFFTQDKWFETVCDEYKGLPDDVLGWPTDMRRALVRRYFSENPELLEYARITYDFEHDGILPEYLRRYSDWM